MAISCVGCHALIGVTGGDPWNALICACKSIAQENEERVVKLAASAVTYDLDIRDNTDARDLAEIKDPSSGRADRMERTDGGR